MAYLKPGIYGTETDYSDTFSWGSVLDHPELCSEIAESISNKVDHTHKYQISSNWLAFTSNNNYWVVSVYLFDGHADVMLGDWKFSRIPFTNKKFIEEIAEIVEKALKE